jgi:predicted nucleic acid-binding protein
MSAVRVVDTSVFCNLLAVPFMDQDRDRAMGELEEAIAGGDVLLLPLPVIYETGNHVAHRGDGSRRRRTAERFSAQVRMAFARQAPWIPTPLQHETDLLAWLADFPDSAMAGIGFTDLAIQRVFEQQCELNPSRRVMVWSYDQHLQGLAREPVI